MTAKAKTQAALNILVQQEKRDGNIIETNVKLSFSITKKIDPVPLFLMIEFLDFRSDQYSEEILQTFIDLGFRVFSRTRCARRQQAIMSYTKPKMFTFWMLRHKERFDHLKIRIRPYTHNKKQIDIP